MIAIDSSAIAAIALHEPEYRDFIEIVAHHACIIGRPTVLEVHMVLRQRSGDAGVAVLDRLLASRHVRVIDFAQEHLAAARQAFERFGKGRGHPAQLNFGDCLSYAIAKVHDVPLLFKGNDFGLTDLTPAYSA